MSCRAYSLQHNYLFWDLVANYAYTEVSSGSPAVEGDATYVSKDECIAYDNTIYAGSGNMGSGIVSGCYTDGNNHFFNTGTTSTECSSIRQCIQKDTSQVTMLCHLGNTLQ